MIYEFFAVIFLLISIFTYFIDPTKILYKNYGGKKFPKGKDMSDKQIKMMIVVLLYLVYGILGLIFTLGFMFWTASKGIIFAKYYAFGLIGLIVFSFIRASFKKNKSILPKKRPFFDWLLFQITSILEIFIILYALWVIF